MSKVSKQVKNEIPTLGLAEIFQNNETRFALCKYDAQADALIQCHQFVKCRDFMLDVLVGVQEDKDIGIYGFKFLKSQPRPSSESTDVLIKMPDAGCLKNFQDNFQILKDIENYVGWNCSFPDLVNYPEEKSVVVWVCGDARWGQSTLTLSLWTYILKCLTYPIKDKTKWMDEIKAAGTVESRYMNKEHINFLLINLDDILSLYKTVSGYKNQKDTTIGTIHNNSGFVSSQAIIEGSPYASKDHVLYNYQKAITAKAA